MKKLIMEEGNREERGRMGGDGGRGGRGGGRGSSRLFSPFTLFQTHFFCRICVLCQPK